MWAVLIAGLGAALIAGLGTLAGQLIGLRQKRLELFFKARAESYRALMERAGKYALEPAPHNYLALGDAYHKALIFASDEVEQALRGLNPPIQGLRRALAEGRVETAESEYNSAADRLAEAMRSELVGGSKKKKK